MLDVMILLAQAGVTAMLGGWMFVGVRDNILHPDMNRTFTGEVMRMERMKNDYPDHYRMVAKRAIDNTRISDALFRLVVVVEVIACALLVIAAAMLALAIFASIDPETARAVALAGCLVFTSIWAGFLIVGNHFAYWYCHEAAQVTHFHLLLAGIGTMIFLSVG